LPISSELPLVKGHTIRVLIANKTDLDSRPDVYRRFMRAYRETVDWMYASDEAAEDLRGIRQDQHRGCTAGARGVRPQGDADPRPRDGTERPRSRRRQVPCRPSI